MRMLQIDTDGGGCAAEACALLDQLNDRPDDQKVVSLGVLTGVDLCLLGGLEHPVSWEALPSAWQQLGQVERERLVETRTLSILQHGLIKDPPMGRGVAALFSPARYPMSAELGVLLGARKFPAFIIATHHESRIPAVTYFQVQGANAIVEEIPERAGTTQSPLDVMFSYVIQGGRENAGGVPSQPGHRLGDPPGSGWNWLIIKVTRTDRVSSRRQWDGWYAYGRWAGSSG